MCTIPSSLTFSVFVFVEPVSLNRHLSCKLGHKLPYAWYPIPVDGHCDDYFWKLKNFSKVGKEVHDSFMLAVEFALGSMPMLCIGGMG